MHYRKLLILPPVLLGGAILYFMAASKKAPEQSVPEERVRYVRSIQVEKMDFLPRVVGYGSVKPGRIWNAVAQVSGRIEQVHPEFKKGALLEAGTEIIRIADTDYKIAIRQAEANIRSAQARLKELGVTEKNNRTALALEEKSLEIKNQELKRKVALLQKGTVAQASVDQERRDLLNQEKRVLDLQNSLKLLPTQKEVQKEQLAVYETQLETAKLNLERTSIKIPFTGRISEVNAEVTQYAGIGANLGAIDGIETAEISVQIPISSLGKMIEPFAPKTPIPNISRTTFRELSKTFGLRASVKLNTGALKVSWDGVVARASDTIDPKTRSAGIIVSVKDHYKMVIPGKRPPLVKGMFVQVELLTNAVKGQIVVPRSAVRENKVYVIEKNRLVVRPVKVALFQGDLAVISKGLAEGENIVVSDVSPVIPNMLLKSTIDKALVRQLKVEASGSREGGGQ